MPDAEKLPPQALKRSIDLSAVNLEHIALPQQATILGHRRAQDALAFGVAMQPPGYNIYVMGDPGTGRLSMIRNHLESLAGQQQTPPSYAYVENFSNPKEPRVIELPAGCGQQFCQDIEHLLDNLLATFPAAFENPAYQQKKLSLERDFNQRYNRAIDRVEEKAVAKNIALFRESDSITFTPLQNEKTLDEDQFARLPQADRDQFHKDVTILEDCLAEALLELPQWRREMAENIKKLDADTINKAIEPLFKKLQDNYLNVDDALFYLDEMKKDLASNTIADLLMPDTQVPNSQDSRSRRTLLIEQYRPNFLIDHDRNSGAPILYETHPVYQNLFGCIEYLSEQGTWVTSYRRICAGALHRANGGYLILDAEKLLSCPFVWEGLKRALQAARIEIDSPFTESAVNSIRLKPAIIPLNIKIILLGSRDIYYLLQDLDSEFNEMFRVLADFDNYIPFDQESVQQFVERVTRHARDSTAKPLTGRAIERLLEHSCRLAEHQQHLSAHINDSLEIIGEAEFLRSRSDAQVIDKTHIEQAISARENRSGRIAQTLLDEMLDGTVLIDSDGLAVGKVNGLTVLEIGNSRFGMPTRITATVHPGSRGIIDIERESELGQSIHSKGVLILSGYLGHRYAQQFPLAISASIAIEQSYGYIDGDSAAMAELCALISALTQIPVKQNYALTGSVNQYGEVQAVGGVNEKIEGFFKLCKARQLRGDQGVIIPAANRRNLMLQQEVVDAVQQGLFAIYAVSHVDQTLQLLTGIASGEMDEQGNYPQDTLNFKVIRRLKEISDLSNERDDEDEEEAPHPDHRTTQKQ